MGSKKLIVFAFFLCGAVATAEQAPFQGPGGENFSLLNPLAGVEKWPSFTPLEMHIIAHRLTKPEVQALSEEQLNLFPKKSLPLLETKMSEDQLARRGLLLLRGFAFDGQIRQVKGRRHPLGGGFVALSAHVDASVYVGPEAAVLDKAQAQGAAWIWDKAILYGQAVIKDHAQMRNKALVGEQATLSDYAVVEGKAHIKGHAVLKDDSKVGGRAVVTDHAQVREHGQVDGQALLRGEAQVTGRARVGGHAIMEQHSLASGNSTVRGGSFLRGEAMVTGHASIGGHAIMKQRARASGQARLRGGVLFGGDAHLWGGTFLDNPDVPFHQKALEAPTHNNRQKVKMYTEPGLARFRQQCVTLFQTLFRM